MDHALVERRKWLALAVLCLSLLITGLDNTILNVALPHLSESLGASNSQLQWIVDSYTLIYAGLILTTGSLGDRFGRKGALTLGLGVFGLGSVMSAFATSATMLIVTRGFMGIGGALIMPATLSILTNVFTDPKERGRAIGVWAGVAAGGIAFGPMIGGVLISHFWWGSVFLVNVPIVIGALVAGHFLLPTSKDPSAPRLDPLGALLSTAGLIVLLFGLIEAPSHGWGAPLIVGSFLAGIAILGAFIAWELHTDHPMLEMAFFRNRRFSAANVAITLVFFALFGSSFLITQELQFVLGYSALKAGFAMMPIAVPMLILGPVSARLVERLGTKTIVTTGLVAVSAGLFWMSRISYGGGYLDILFPMILLASGMGLVMAPATESIMGSLPRAKAGIGSAMNDTTRQVGGALGVAVIGSVLASVYQPHVTSKLSGTVLGQAAKLGGPTGAQAQTAIGAIKEQIGAAYGVVDAAAKAGHPFSPAQAQGIIEAARHAFVDGFGGAVLVGAMVALLGALVAVLFLPQRAVDVPEEPATADSATQGPAQPELVTDGRPVYDGEVPVDTNLEGITAASFGSASVALVEAEREAEQDEQEEQEAEQEAPVP
jgi:EmrB/QacA subfamily drug resistance transporter